MNTATTRTTSLILRGHTAEDLMTSNPVSLRDDATLHEAIAFLVDKGISGAPVIDEAGRPIGVLTRSDIVTHDREQPQHLEQEVDSGSPLPPRWWGRFQLERVDTTVVRDLMTPAVYSVRMNADAWTVIERMRELSVHRIFVVDDNGVLVGVITSLDIVRHLARA